MFVIIIDYVLYVLKFFMKKVFIQIRQLILKHRKRLIYGVLAFLIGQICFFGLEEIWIENQVFAEENQEQSIEKNAQKKVDTLSFVQKLIYVLIYPMLVVAGTLVDNSMVYWEFFNFDVVLWQLWNMMRNLANFTLWFIFVYKIFKYLIWDQKSWEIKKLLISLLIAWIWIQASWFVMSALIDMSTILTYWVWWLPITVLKDNDDKNKASAWQTWAWWENWDNQDNQGGQPDNNTTSQWKCTDKDSNEKYNPYVYKTLITVDVEEEDTSAIRMYLTNTTWDHIYISQCASFKYTGAHEILVAPSTIYYSYYDYKTKEQIFKPTEKGLCHYGWQVYQFADGAFTSEHWCKEGDGKICKTNQTSYKSELEREIEKLGWKTRQEIIELIASAKLLEEWNAHAPGWIQWALRTGHYEKCDQWLDVDNVEVWAGHTQRLQDTLDDKSYVWVFTQLYSSLMTSGRNIIGSTWDSWFLNLLAIVLELWHLIAIGIPLIVVGIIFMIRIWILWTAIVISPFIAILTAFEDDIGKFMFEKIKALKYFKLTTLIWIIFSPAVICLAISLSTVFVTIISNIDLNWIDWTDLDNSILWWLIQINIAKVSVGIWRFLKAFIGAAITWYIVWAAVQSSKLWEMKLVESLKNLAENSIWSIPIVPVPTKDGWVELIWANSAFGLNGSKWIIWEAASQIESKYTTQANEAVKDLFGEWMSDEDAKTKRVSTYSDRLLSMYPQSDWRTQQIEVWEKWSKKEIMTFNHNDLDAKSKKEIIKNINKDEDEKKRVAFGQVTPTVKIWDDDYEFRDKDKQIGNVTIKAPNKYMTEEEYDDYIKQETEAQKKASQPDNSDSNT